MSTEVEQDNCAHCAEKFTPMEYRSFFFHGKTKICEECHNYWNFRVSRVTPFRALVNTRTRYRPKINKVYNDDPKIVED
jgi:hypothetical protein